MKDSIDFEKRAKAISAFVDAVQPLLDRMCEHCLAAGSVAHQVKFTAAAALVGVVAHAGGVRAVDASQNAGGIIIDTMVRLTLEETAS